MCHHTWLQDYVTQVPQRSASSFSNQIILRYSQNLKHSWLFTWFFFDTNSHHSSQDCRHNIISVIVYFKDLTFTSRGTTCYLAVKYCWEWSPERKIQSFHHRRQACSAGVARIELAHAALFLTQDSALGLASLLGKFAGHSFHFFPTASSSANCREQTVSQTNTADNTFKQHSLLTLSAMV